MDNQKAIEFVLRLIRMTKEKKIEWSVTTSPRSDSIPAYITSISDRGIRIYRSEREILESEDPNELSIFFSATRKRRKMIPEAVLEIYDEFRGIPIYTFQAIAGTNDLLESAAYSAAGVDEFVDSVLAE